MPADAFLDNWSYLKVELNWLERLLLTAVARQKKDLKEIDRVARSQADRATSHWWKGLVSLEGTAAYDSPAKNYQAQAGAAGNSPTLEARIRASQSCGIVLGLPTLYERLALTPFEKNLILVALAPEVNRRYAQLYGYLQTKEQCDQLPTVDLVLKLFCRNDSEWRAARSRLTATSPLVQHRLIDLYSRQETSLLSRFIKLADPLVNWLLAENPNLADLADLRLVKAIGNGWLTPADEGAKVAEEGGAEIGDRGSVEPLTSCSLTAQSALNVAPEAAVLSPVPAAMPQLCDDYTCSVTTSPLTLPSLSGASVRLSAYVETPLSDAHSVEHSMGMSLLSTPCLSPSPYALVLPAALQATLQHLCDRYLFSAQVDQEWGFQTEAPGTIALLVGAAGTGKTAAAKMIAQTIAQPLWEVDLATLPPDGHVPLLQEIAAQNPPLLLIKSAQIWLGRSSLLAAADIQKFLTQRRQGLSLTLLSVRRVPTLSQGWRSSLQLILQFPLPDQTARQQLWRQAFPPQISLSDDIRWEWLAQKFALTGGEIQQRARSAAIYAAADSCDHLTMGHILQALADW